MKIKVEFDLTPQEFRAVMGWPDVSELQQLMLNEIKEKMQTGADGYDPLTLMKPFLMQSASTMEGFQSSMMKLMEGYFSSGSKKN